MPRAEAPGVEISSVELHAPARGLRCDLVLPRKGRERRFALDLRGQLVAEDGDIPGLVLRSEGGDLRRIDVLREDVPGRSGGSAVWQRPGGFNTTVGTLGLSESFRVTLEAVREGDGSRELVAEVRGRQAPLFTRRGLTPVLVSGLGRSGSTWLVHLLGSHHECVAYRPFTYEPRAVGYWVSAVGDLSEPASQMAMLGTRGYPPQWWLGEQGRPPLRWEDEPIAAWLGGESVRRLASFAADSVHGFYRRVATIEGRRPKAFVEKSVGRLDQHTWRLTEKLFPGAREVLLLRDPRDVAASILAYMRKRPEAVLGPPNAGPAELSVWAARAMVERSRLADARRNEAITVRYEDLVRDPAVILETILGSIGLDDSASAVERTLAAAVDDPGKREDHRTSATPADSIGRWRNDPAIAGPIGADSTLPKLLKELGY